MRLVIATIFVVISFFCQISVGAEQKFTPEFKAAVKAAKSHDYKTAFDIFEKLAPTQNPAAQYNLALLYNSGKGRPQNFYKALIWGWLAYLNGIEKAAEFSENLLLSLPTEAIDKARKDVEVYLQRQIDNGQSDAILQLAEYYLKILPEPDFLSAFKWQTIASALNIKNAPKLRDKTATNLTKEEIYKAQIEINELFITEEYEEKFQNNNDD